MSLFKYCEYILMPHMQTNVQIRTDRKKKSFEGFELLHGLISNKVVHELKKKNIMLQFFLYKKMQNTEFAHPVYVTEAEIFFVKMYI